ncbi:tyrosine-type recombinase/integrase [Sulfitobacter sp. D35]|uniref:tyrosine-type recombinase/integrase n=1 Tax=Sulfitobacter sp. D35 TaxID=3083252 RepID=UPI00296EB6E1|nr:tyrosine-type recombinase/integrase [Sulfitobacter sp. D35]MDW4496353.1 tyrosine-type recombinase/integrase [Sulfitobacter sp. D35]
MPTVRLTRKTIATLPASERRVVFYDETLKGFGLAVRPTGARKWIVEYRPGSGGRGVAKRRITLGDPETLTPEAARAMAKEILAKARLGQDVAAERSSERLAETVAEIAERWMANHVEPKRKPSTAALYRGVLDCHILPALGSRKAVSLTRQDVSKMHQKVAAKVIVKAEPRARRGARVKSRGGPYIANRCLAVVKAMFSWALDMGLLPESSPNPAARVEAFREKGRERFLTEAEMGRLGVALSKAETEGLPWQVDETMPNAKHLPKTKNRVTCFDAHSVAAVRLLLLTGARVSEILNLEWKNVDWERGLLRLPDSKTGAKPIFLSSAALAILDELPKLGRYVIASTSAGTSKEKPRADINRLWRAVRTEAGLEGVRLHDLRHSAAAVGAGAGLSLHQIGGLLGHSQPSTTRRYAHLADDPMRRAADVIGSEVASALGLGTNVVPLVRASRT